VRVRQMFTDQSFGNLAFAYETTVENLQVRIAGDLAWATFRQRYPADTRETRAASATPQNWQAVDTGVPHSMQNVLPSDSWALQFRHSMPHLEFQNGSLLAE